VRRPPITVSLGLYAMMQTHQLIHPLISLAEDAVLSKEKARMAANLESLASRQRQLLANVADPETIVPKMQRQQLKHPLTPLAEDAVLKQPLTPHRILWWPPIGTSK